MPSKLTVYIDDSLRQFLKESAGNGSVSKLVSDALESYMSEAFVRDLKPPDDKKDRNFPSLSEVKKRRPRAKGSSAEIIASQRRSRNARLS
jgi:hypothetical protein